MKGLELEARPFYAARLDRRGQPRPWDLGELEDFAAATGDPFGGRLLADHPVPPLSLQLEACDEPPVWVGLEPRALEAWVRPLERSWRRYGLAPGEAVALFDYGSSPLVLLAAAGYAPYLRRGAADRLGARAICNDGVASLVARMVSIFERVKPAALVARRDVLAPLAEAIDVSGVELAEFCRWVMVSEPDGVPPARDVTRVAKEWGVPVRRILRADAAFLLAAECERCDAFHVDARSYRVESLDAAAVAVTTRFGRTCPAVRHRLDGFALLPDSCDAEPDASRLRCV
ncbi:MAG: hypothetical protein V3V67_02525 [Myxococcota bacterium]